MYYSFESFQPAPENRGGDPYPGGFTDAIYGDTTDPAKSLQLAANPKCGWQFVRWEIEITRYDSNKTVTNVVSDNPNHTITVTGGDNVSVYVVAVPFYAYNGTGKIISDRAKIVVNDASKILVDQ